MMGWGWSPHWVAEDEYERLVEGMNPPRVTVDNTSSRTSTLLKVDSVNKNGSLLEVVQVLNDLNLITRRAYIQSDGQWFMDVFYVVDRDGNKVRDSQLIHGIEQSLQDRAFNLRSLRRSVGVQPAEEHTSIELIGRDRPGLLSDVFAVLTDLGCNISAAQVWTHNFRMASVVCITDELTGLPIHNPDHLAKIKRLLRYVLKGNADMSNAKTSILVDDMHTERRLHQMMYNDRDYETQGNDTTGTTGVNNLIVTVDNCDEKGYIVVSISCKDRPKLVFDTVCTLTDMQYVVFHGTILAESTNAYQEYFIRHIDGCVISSEGERQRLISCLEAAIRRGTTEGLRLELCSKDRTGLLSDITRIFRENGLSVTRAEVSTRGSQAVNVFYVTDASGNPVQRHMIEAVQNKMGDIVLHVKDENSSSQENQRFSFSNLLRSGSERFLYNLGLIRSST